jgi:CTP synthase
MVALWFYKKIGLVFGGTCRLEEKNDMELAETIEIPGHEFFVACQYHPEFTGRILRCNPMFDSFVKAAIRVKDREPGPAGDGHRKKLKV